jgi:antitoxin CcdA
MGKVDLNIKVDAGLLARAREAGVALDAASEAGIRQALSAIEGPDTVLADTRAKQWAQENAHAIRRHNERIAARGIFGEDLRRW